MLQFDRQLVNGSRLIRGSHSKPPTDFVSRNKRAIRDKSRSQTAAKNAANATITEQRSKVRPRSRKALDKQQERKREGWEARKQATEGPNSDTVVISKSYLDELLRMSVTVRDETRNKNMNSHHQTAPMNSVSDGGRREESVRHVNIEASQIPGLGSVSTNRHVATALSGPSHQITQPTGHAQNYNTQQATYQVLTPSGPQHTVSSDMPTAPKANYEGLSAREKWLQELASQVEEQKAKKERNRLLKQQSTVEEYFPFGRPGGGAPIKSQSGTLLTDYRSRTRVQEQGGVATRGHLETDKANDVHMHQEHSPFRTALEGKNPGGHVASQPATSVFYHGGNTGVSDGGDDVMMMSPRHGAAQEQHKETYNTTPRFARGAGPHVDQYMRKEMEEKRRKQMEHMEFVRQQVAEKERLKLEEKLRREREDAIEEARLARERERMKEDFQREKEKARRKEIEARQRQALLQHRILEAEQSARRAKLEARGVIVNSTSHPTVSFDEHSTLTRSMGSDFLGDGVYSSLSKSDFRSPSMHQLVNATTEAGHRGDDNAPPTQRGVVNKARTVERSKVSDGVQRGQVDQKRRNSRIPVVQPSVANKAMATRSKGVLGTKVQSSKVDMTVRSDKILMKRLREGGARPVHAAATTTASVINRPIMERSFSPPVPALAKRLTHQHKPMKNDTVQYTQLRDIQGDVNFIRSSSPPVPAVAKKLRNGKLEIEDYSTETASVSHYRRTTSPPLPALAKAMRGNDAERVGVPEVMQPLHQRVASPPVPAVARRLRDEGAGMSGDKDRTTTDDLRRELSYNRAASPPIPTVAKRLQQNKESKLNTVPHKNQSLAQPGKLETTEALNSQLKIDFSPGILTGESEISINRPPSCKPESKPLSPVAMTTNLPVIATASTSHHHDNQGSMPHLPSSNRQRLILQQLTMLKEGILTQRNSIDHRVHNILNRNKQCTF